MASREEFVAFLFLVEFEKFLHNWYGQCKRFSNVGQRPR